MEVQFGTLSYTDELHDELEMVQNGAALFLTRNYVYVTGSTTGILAQLKRESLKKRKQRSEM